LTVQTILLALIRAQLSDQSLQNEEKEFLCKASEQDWTELLTLCTKQNVMSVVYETLKQNPDIAIPAFALNVFKSKAYSTPVQYYQKISVLRQILKYLREENIAYYVLKGVGLNTMYPKEEMRSFGDIDLYIPRAEDVEKAHSFFVDRNCTVDETFSDNHTAYVYKGSGVACEVEVHWKMTAEFNNGDLDQRLNAIYRQLDGSQYMTVMPMQMEVHILPPTYNALHLLAHMLQHLMYTGFGLKLFCDWSVFWQKHGHEVNMEQFLGWIKDLHIENFLYAVTAICIRHLGLPEVCCPWMRSWKPDEELLDSLLRDVFTGGEHGKYDSGRMIITTRKPGLKTYLLELHRQMKRRFRRIGKIVLLWPVLWLLTGIIFVYNNMTLRNVSTKKILESNKERSKLVQKLDVFTEK
jgi:hypothetical protein